MSVIKNLDMDNQLQSELTAAGEKLVVVYYSASWCMPCKKMKPIVELLSKKHPNVVFLKLDVDTCQATAMEQGVTAMPTFAFHKKMEKIDTVLGADPVALEEKINRHETSKDEGLVPGHSDLLSNILIDHSECMNESDEFTFKNVFYDNELYLQSGTDAQMIMSVVFKQRVRLHSIRIKAPQDSGPKDLKIFINQPTTLGFDSAESNTPVQELKLAPSQLNGSPINLQFVKYQNVTNVQIFVKNNQDSLPKTIIKYLGFIGTPKAFTNVGDINRVSSTVKGSMTKNETVNIDNK